MICAANVPSGRYRLTERGETRRRKTYKGRKNDKGEYKNQSEYLKAKNELNEAESKNK